MITNFLYIIVGILGIITVFILSINHKTNRKVNLYFILFLLLYSLNLFLNAFYYFNENLSPTVLYRPFLLIVIPTVYLYLKNLILNTKKYNPKELYQFIFPIFLACFISINFHHKILGQYSSYYMFFVFCSFVLVYLFSGILLFKNSVWSNKKIDLIVYNKNRNIKNWLDFLFIIFVLCSIRVLLTAFLDLFYVGINFGQNTMWITCCFIVILLIKIWTSPNILYGYNALYEKVKYEKFSKLSLNEIWILTPICNIKNIQDNALKENVYINLKKQINRIEKIAIKDKWFRNNKYSKSELAEKLNIPKSHLNFIFKYHSKLSYAEFVNKARTFDAIELIESGYLSTHKMDSLALKVGYMSYNPFFLTFKDIMGVSPMEYNKLKNNLK